MPLLPKAGKTMRPFDHFPSSPPLSLPKIARCDQTPAWSKYLQRSPMGRLTFSLLPATGERFFINPKEQ
jgi:hypothetical protein